jgi:hypothetical protein
MAKSVNVSRRLDIVKRFLSSGRYLKNKFGKSIFTADIITKRKGIREAKLMSPSTKTGVINTGYVLHESTR